MSKGAHNRLVCLEELGSWGVGRLTFHCIYTLLIILIFNQCACIYLK